MYICSYALILLIGLYIAIFIDSLFWFVLGGIVVLGFIRYLVFDAILDELEWKSTWYHFYSDEVTPHTPEQALIKKYEQNPNPENYKALQKHLQAK